MAQHPKRCPSNLMAVNRRPSRAVQLADTAACRGNPREQNAKPPREQQSPAGQPKQARKPKEAKRNRSSQGNPKANLKKRASQKRHWSGGSPKTLALEPEPQQGQRHTEHAQNLQLHHQGRRGFRSSHREKRREKKGGGTQTRPSKTFTADRFPSKKPHGASHGASGKGWKSAEANLAEDALAGQKLGTQADHKTQHGKTAIPGFCKTYEAKTGGVVGHGGG